MFSSGMAAVSTCLFACARPGDVIVHSTPVYGGTDFLPERILPEVNIRGVGYAAGTLDALEHAVERAQSIGVEHPDDLVADFAQALDEI